MRRIISMTAALMLAGNTAFASPIITSKDAVDNIINISGEANVGDTVSLLIVNPDYTPDDVYTAPASAQQYVRSYVTNDSAYSFDVAMNVPTAGGGTFTAVVNAGGKSETVEFSFYPIATKLETIEAINNASSASDLTSSANGKSVIDRAIEVYSLDAFVLSDDIKKTDLANILINESGSGFDNDDADAMYSTLKAAIYVAALNNSSENVFDKNGYLIEPEAFGIAGTKTHDAYLSSLNEDGIEAVNAFLPGAGFETVDEATEAFDKSVVLNLITNNKKYGNGHVEEILEEYEEILDGAGFNLSRLSKIKKKSGLYDMLVSSKAKTLEKLADDFNDYEDSESSSSGGGGSSGVKGGSNATVSSIPSAVADYIPSAADTPVQTVFDDINSVEWAKEAIEALAANGIVNGKGNNKFDPDATVTRAEFTKMVIGAASLTNLNANCTFSDVTEDWAKPYVASASELGIVTGIDENTFAPSDSISRQQAAVIIYRVLTSLGITVEGEAVVFDDAAEADDYAKEAIDKLSGAKIINGKGNNRFEPRQSLTRAEAAKIIYTALNSKLNLE